MRKYEVTIRMEADFVFSVDANSREEAEEQASCFIDSDNFFEVVREKCEFYSPEICETWGQHDDGVYYLEKFY